MPRERFQVDPVEDPQPEALAQVPPEAPAELCPVAAWLDELMPTGSRAQTMFRAAHAAAAVVHGWLREEREYARAVVISREDYEKALEAVGIADDSGNPTVHEPALGKFERERREKNAERRKV